MSNRLAGVRGVSDALAGLDDVAVRRLLDARKPVGVGIGGATHTVRIKGTTVFVKQLPLTGLELADPTATASRFELPFACHYGIGSPAKGVGRELAAHQLTSEWVQAGKAEFFPLLLGWRIVDLKCELDLSEFRGAAPQRRWGAHWSQIRAKVTAMEEANTSMLLFLEYAPETLGALLRRSVAVGSCANVFPDVFRQIVEAAEWMKRQGFQHFDIHPGNILVQDGRLLFTDFGLALYQKFQLTPEEKTAMVMHRTYDRDIAIMHLFHWMLFELGYSSSPERLSLLRSAAVDPATPALDEVRATLGAGTNLIVKYANVAVRATEMFDVLMQDASATRYSGAANRAGSA